MAKSFEFLFDVGGPNGYLVHRILPDFCKKTGATARYVPILLGGLMKATGNQPPFVRYAETPAKWDYEQLEFERFIKKHGLTRYKRNPHFPINSLVVMRTVVAADRLGKLQEATDAAMTALWEEDKNLGDLDEIRAVYDAAGLDGAALLALAQDPSIKEELVRNTERAVARGAFGIPTFFVGEDMFWGKERLAQVEAALA